MSTPLRGVNTPVDPSITFEVPDARSPAKMFAEGLLPGEQLYGRFRHPNFQDLASQLSRMEHGGRAILFASGMSATFSLFFSLLSVGDHIVVSSRIYGGTRGQINMLAHKLKLEVDVVDIADVKQVRDACRHDTKLLFAETVSNPDMVVADIAELARICRSDGRDILCCIDNTFTPLIARPLVWGADIVMHSTTKYIGGHSDVMGGALIGSPGMNSFMDGLVHPATGEVSLIGPTPHYEVAQRMAERFAGLKDRVYESSKRAFALAKLFVRAGLDVRYPLLNPSYILNQLSCLGEPLGGGVFSVAFSTEEEGARFVDHVRDVHVCDPLFGDVRLAIPAVSLGSSHTYVWCTTEARAQGKVTKWPALPFAPVPLGFVRVAVGYLGDRALVLDAFEQALKDLGYTIAPEEPVFFM